MRRFYLDVISGRRRGLLAAIMRLLLSLGSIVYAVLHGTRRLFYALGILRSVKLPCAVVSVGNLTAGGTGKTPLVEYLARWFARQNLRTVVLARGYGRTGQGDDEDLLAELELENVVRLTAKNRAALARKAAQDYKADVIILDDGFQHYRIQRDLDILTIDATNPFAGERLLPRGLLRERPRAAARADLLVLTRTDQADRADVDALRDRLIHLTGRGVVETVHRPVHIRNLWNKKKYGLDWLKGRAVYAFCGLGNPDAFRRTLEWIGADVVKFRAFDDHHRYPAADLRRLNAEAQEFMAEVMVTTEKDALKLHPETFERPLNVLRVELEVTRGEDQLETRLRELVRSRATAPTAALPR